MTLAELLAETVPLVFVRSGSKWYARTPEGELAYGEGQGLYEWRKHGRERVDHTGADRSSDMCPQTASIGNQAAEIRGRIEAQIIARFGGGWRARWGQKEVPGNH